MPRRPAAIIPKKRKKNGPRAPKVPPRLYPTPDSDGGGLCLGFTFPGDTSQSISFVEDFSSVNPLPRDGVNCLSGITHDREGPGVRGLGRKKVATMPYTPGPMSLSGLHHEVLRLSG